jgi:hypothetical protein
LRRYISVDGKVADAKKFILSADCMLSCSLIDWKKKNKNI